MSDLLNSEAFIIVVSGVIIFSIQKFISDIWISPNLEFNKALTKIETLLIKSMSMYKWTYKKNNMRSSLGISMGEDIDVLRKDINLATWNLISTYNSLFFLEKLWLRLIGVDINKSRPALLTLSVTICHEDDWKQDDGGSLAEKKMNERYIST